MTIQPKRLPPALKHGAYSEVVLLPGEDPAEFEELHRGLIAEFAPNGRMEEETVASIARLVWRRQNLAKFEIGQLSHFMAESLEKAVAKATQEHKNRQRHRNPRVYRNGKEHENGEEHEISKEDKELIAELEKLISANRRAHKATRNQQRKREAAQELVEWQKRQRSIG